MSGTLQSVQESELREEGGPGADGEQDGLFGRCFCLVSLGGDGLRQFRVGEDEPHERAGGLGSLGEDGFSPSARDEEDVVGVVGFQGFLYRDVALD